MQKEIKNDLFEAAALENCVVKARRSFSKLWKTGYLCLDPKARNKSYAVQSLDWDNLQQAFPIDTIDPETVCAFAGETVTGVQIFANDVLEWEEYGEIKRGLVKWDVDAWYCGGDRLDEVTVFDAEVIGNILDDRTLLAADY